ncbi:MAG: ABC transporter ATP-binding protein [Deltaproteobacteria bacterium]|nr:ABC transporter ATP-binding protein [Deltaproteobacteria bacterium]MBW2678931.1 ABC transporter ATP-binding protein [Deltaproteobacteria bacterium]
MIELKDLNKQYSKTRAVRDLNLKISSGEIFGFIGPNGAGKTTTIKMMGGILIPTSGTVHICGLNIKDHPEAAKQKIGFIPDRPYLYEKLTGMEFLKFIADLYGVARNTFMEKAHRNLEMFTLADWGDELIEAYSHGMKQRLIMAAALLHDPAVIIVDEPMVGLDPLGIKLVKDLFRRLARTGVTVFLSTHTLQVAEDLCDRIGIINKGRLITTGSPDSLKRDLQKEDADLEHVFLRLTQNA